LEIPDCGALEANAAVTAVVAAVAVAVAAVAAAAAAAAAADREVGKVEIVAVLDSDCQVSGDRLI
jgi:hypothetical protein